MSVISGQHAGEIKAADEEFQLTKFRENTLVESNAKCLRLGVKRLPAKFTLQGRVPAGDDTRESPPVGRGLGGEILHQLAIGGDAAASRAVKTALGRKIGIGSEKITLEGIAADELHQKALTTAIAADQKAH